MMKYIPNRHIKRMFPYEFFKELHVVLTGYSPENVVFALQDTEYEHLLDDNKRQQFNDVRAEMLGDKTLEENNIYQLDQGEFLIIDNYIRREDREKFIKKQPVDQFVLLGQLYDKNEEPVFSKEGSLKTVRQIPEVLWDDPNLALVLMQVSSANDQDTYEETVDLGIIKGPDHFIKRFVEDPNVERTDSL